MNRIISIDPGFSNTGYVIWELGAKDEIIETGVIETEKSDKKSTRVSDDNASRCAIIASGLKEAIEKHGVKFALVELPTAGAKSSNAMKAMALVTGVVCGVLTVLNIPVEFATPNDVKLRAVKKRTATKEEMIAWAHKCYPWDSYPKTKGKMEHVADAVAVFNALSSSMLVRIARNAK